jgi:hypothetical protein
MYDIVLISYQEPNAEQNWESLKLQVPTAKRVHGVKGIHNAHISAAKKCFTKMFWIVDGDAIVLDEFDFNYEVDKWNLDTVHVWRSRNPINGLEYGNGGIKLFPRKLTINMDTTTTDMTTSISDKFKAVQQVSNINAFNTDPFSTWKSAFRECVKLESKVINRQKSEETDERLKVWTTVGSDKPFGEYAIKGARAGVLFGAKGDNLHLINDFNWLREVFDATA